LRNFLTYIFLAFTFSVFGQLAPPSLRCLSVNNSGDVTLNWAIPPDPSSSFVSYEIYMANLQAGPYNLVGTVNTYTQNTYSHPAAGADIQSRFFFLKTISTGSISSVNSDTLRTIFLNLNNPGNGRALMNWNATKNPLLPTASSTYTLQRESPLGTWTTIFTGSNFNYIDTITICSINYNYRIKTSDALTCESQSNLPGGLFSDLTSPFTPKLDSISVNAAGKSVLGWQASASDDAIGYVIYKWTGVWTALDTVFGHNTTSYLYNASTANAGSEGFCIAAIDSCRNISPLGDEQKTIFLSSNYDLCSRSANHTWTAYSGLPQGILRYDIYCSINAGSYNLIGNSTSTTFLHENLNPGDNYCYVVKVRNTPQSISANSNRVCLDARAPQGPDYVYIRSVSVNHNKQIEVTYAIDNTRAYQGATIYRSEDGITFSQIDYQVSGGAAQQTYIDNNVKVASQNYFYKVQITDSCGNPGKISNVSKNIVAQVSNDSEQIFFNTITWDDYSSWIGNVNSYNIYRAVNGVYEATPIANVVFGTRSYIDNVQDFVSEQGKFSYYIEAVEGAGNTYGFQDVVQSNKVDAYVEVNVFVPNAFAPNGINNIWKPIAQYVEKTDYSVKVFNRWGNIVFQTSDDNEGWNGQGADDEMYVYLIEYKNARGEYIQLKGHLNLLK
jgi:gliding motility-associated-like protein